MSGSLGLGLYLYAIVGARPRAAMGVGIAGGALSVVRAGGAHVVVEHAAPPEPTAKNLRAHDRIVKRIAAATPSVLPFRFGSMATDGKALRALLEPVTAAIGKALELVDGCVQYTLRVYGDPGRADARNEPAKTRVGPGTQWLDLRLRARRVPEIAPVTEATSTLVRAARAQRHDRPPLVASVYHLVARADAKRYRAALARATRDLSDVEVRTSGPWPPYAFAELP